MLFRDFQTIACLCVKIHAIYVPQVRPAVARSDVALRVIAPARGAQNQRSIRNHSCAS